MLTILSPAKKLDFTPQNKTNHYTVADHLSKSVKIMDQLKKMSKKDIAELMNLSEKLANENYERNLTWNNDFSPENAKQAILTFNGEVYNGLKAETLTEEELLYAQDHVRILSGLHGVLRPLDLIKPYRLEMGTKLAVNGHKNLTEYWKDTITDDIVKVLNKEKVLINLASNEYTKPINFKIVNAKIITPVFKDYKNGKYKPLFVYVKKARGMMMRFIVKNRIEDPEQLKNFEEEGYFYNETMSTGKEFVFTRG
ncbi:MAG: peroxide stress protein YaaA [Bacteroidota bacterium]